MIGDKSMQKLLDEPSVIHEPTANTVTKKVLIVEDDPATQFMMAEFMDALGYSYELAEDGDICLDLLANESHRFALILMDIHMPKFSGIEASARIRDMQEDPPRNLPIYLMSADQNYHSPRAAHDLGLTGALPKPVRMGELDSLLGSYL